VVAPLHSLRDSAVGPQGPVPQPGGIVPFSIVDLCSRLPDLLWGKTWPVTWALGQTPKHTNVYVVLASGEAASPRAQSLLAEAGLPLVARCMRQSSGDRFRSARSRPFLPRHARPRPAPLHVAAPRAPAKTIFHLNNHRQDSCGRALKHCVNASMFYPGVRLFVTIPSNTSSYLLCCVICGSERRRLQPSQFRRAAALAARLRPPSIAPQRPSTPEEYYGTIGMGCATVAVHAPTADRPSRLVRRLTLHGKDVSPCRNASATPAGTRTCRKHS